MCQEVSSFVLKENKGVASKGLGSWGKPPQGPSPRGERVMLPPRRAVVSGGYDKGVRAH